MIPQHFVHCTAKGIGLFKNNILFPCAWSAPLCMISSMLVRVTMTLLSWCCCLPVDCGIFYSNWLSWVLNHSCTTSLGSRWKLFSKNLVSPMWLVKMAKVAGWESTLGSSVKPKSCKENYTNSLHCPSLEDILMTLHFLKVRTVNLFLSSETYCFSLRKYYQYYLNKYVFSCFQNLIILKLMKDSNWVLWQEFQRWVVIPNIYSFYRFLPDSSQWLGFSNIS